MVDCRPHVLVHARGLISAPDETAAEEGREEHDAVVELGTGASHVELVEEPVEVQERRRELIEDEGAAVVVDERPLRRLLLVGVCESCEGLGGPYEAKGEYYERTHGVRQHAQAKEIHILESDHQVPQEVASCKALDHARTSSIAPYALFPVHGLALLIPQHYV